MWFTIPLMVWYFVCITSLCILKGFWGYILHRSSSKLCLVANCDIYILFAVTEHQGDKRKDYMSLEVVPEDESKETEVMEEDEQTKVNHLNPVSIKFCTFIFIAEVKGMWEFMWEFNCQHHIVSQ